MCGDAPPPPPSDPKVTAAQQQQLNTATTAQNQAASQTNQITPWGSSMYYQTGVGPNGIPTYTNVQNLTPQQATLLALQQQGSGLAAGAGANALAGAFDQYSTPQDFTGADGLTERLMGRQLEQLTPHFETQTNQLDTKLRNQGIMPGTPAYDQQMKELRGSQDMAVTSFLNQAEPMAFDQALKQYMLPAQLSTNLMGLNQVVQPNQTYISTPQATGAPADLVGATSAADKAKMDAYKIQQDQQSAMMSGLFKTAGTVGAAMMMSDRKVKSDIARVGTLDDGTAVYRYRIGDGPFQIGLMAQDVQTYAPDAVAEHGGILMVDYKLATDHVAGIARGEPVEVRDGH